jgi:hypothetical protein
MGNMSEFKGTKGKWIVEKAERDSNGRGVYRVVTWNIPNNPDLQYNAQLISKAPEMLEMLEIILESKDAECHLESSINDSIKKLIKEATTI